MPSYTRGDLLGEDSRWRVVRTLGEGQFAEVFEVEDTVERVDKGQNRFALKLERRSDTNSVLGEYKVLRKIRGSPFVPRVMELGEHDSRYFIVMDLLGRNLHCTRSGYPGGKVEYRRVRDIGLATLEALRSVHEAGYVHRDVKPANFVVGHEDTDKWFIVDFGLARRFLDENGDVVAERLGAGFRGSSTYASFHAQQERDQGRRDDLWSWLYTLVELITGTLPWRHFKDRYLRKDCGMKVLQKKLLCRDNPEELTAPTPLPHALTKICNYLKTLEFSDSPNYEAIKEAMKTLEEGPLIKEPDDRRQFRRNNLSQGKGQGAGSSDGQTRTSHGPPSGLDQGNCHKNPPAACDKDLADGLCVPHTATPPPTADRGHGVPYRPGNPETPDHFHPGSGKYSGSAQSARTGPWDGRGQDHSYSNYHRYHSDGNYQCWPHQEGFSGRPGWGGGQEYYRDKGGGGGGGGGGGRFRNGSWRSYQWSGVQGNGWNHSNVGGQGHYPGQNFQNSAYQGFNYPAEPARASPGWNQEPQGFPGYGPPFVHGYPGGDNPPPGNWRNWGNNVQQGWHPRLDGGTGPPGSGFEGQMGGRPPDGAHPMLDKQGLKELPVNDIGPCPDKWRPDDGMDVPGLGDGSPSHEVDGGDPGEDLKSKYDAEPNCGEGEQGIVNGRDRMCPNRVRSRDHVGIDPGKEGNKRCRLDGPRDEVEEGNEVGIKFMQDCVQWVRSDQGPARARPLIQEFASMDPLEGVSYVATICDMLGSGRPDPVVRSILTDLGSFAGFLARRFDKRVEERGSVD